MWNFKNMIEHLNLIESDKINELESFYDVERYLINEKNLTKQDIHVLYEFMYNIPYISLQSYNSDNQILNDIPYNICKQNNLLPLKKYKKSILVALNNPFDKVVLNKYNNLEFVLSDRDIIKKIINKIDTSDEFSLSKNIMKIDKKDDDMSTYPIVKYIDDMIKEAINLNASDIHIEPMRDFCRVRYRIDGNLIEVLRIQKDIYSFIVSRLKVMSNLDISKKRQLQDGRIDFVIDNIHVDIRVSIVPLIYGEKVVIRILNKDESLVNKYNLGFDNKDLKLIDESLKNQNGIILVTGPTGSGKTTTLYALLMELNNISKNIVTIEDPVEFKIDGINQIQIDKEMNIDFASSLKSTLRQDPDVIMLGEIRDLESADIAIKSAITGHLVLSTIHTNNAVSTIIRLLDMGIDSYLIKSSLVSVISQRLVRKICPYCKYSYTISCDEKEVIKIDENINLYRGRGCLKCKNTGYKGRIGVYEILNLDKEIKSYIKRDIDEAIIKEICIKKGMKSLKSSCKNLLLSGYTTFDEYIKLSYIN